jgi:hypothetical protein
LVLPEPFTPIISLTMLHHSCSVKNCGDMYLSSVYHKKRKRQGKKGRENFVYNVN